MSTEARAIVVVSARTAFLESDPSALVIPPDTNPNDLAHAPTHASDMYHAIWSAKCRSDGGLSPSILQWVLVQDVVKSSAVQVMEYIFGSIGFWAANGLPNLSFLDRNSPAFYVLTATPVLIGWSYMLEGYALDLGRYILGVGVTWEPIPPDQLHPTGRRFFTWLQLFHV